MFVSSERAAALQAGDEEPAGSEGGINQNLLLLKVQADVLTFCVCVCERAGSPAAEAVLPGSIHPADEAGAAPSRHDEGRTQQPERTTNRSPRGPTCRQLVVTDC